MKPFDNKFSQYERPVQSKKKVKFQLSNEDIIAKLDLLLKKSHQNDSEIATRLLKEILLFDVPSVSETQVMKAAILQLKKEIKELDEGMLVREREAKTQIGHDIESKRNQLNKTREAHKNLESSLLKIQNLNNTLLNITILNPDTQQEVPILEQLGELLKKYKYWRPAFGEMPLTVQEKLKSDPIDSIKEWLVKAKEEIIKEYPMEFSQGVEEFQSYFDALSEEKKEAIKLQHATNIVKLKHAELNALSYPKDESIQKEKLRKEVIFQIKNSRLQHKIMRAIFNEKTSTNNIIQTNLEVILTQLHREIKLNVCHFKYPQNLKEDIFKLLEENSHLLVDREKNEMELDFCNIQWAAYAELTNNNVKYGILDRERGEKNEDKLQWMEERREELWSKQKKLNFEYNKMINDFVIKNSTNQEQIRINEINKKYKLKQNKDIEAILEEANQSTQLGFFDFISTNNFAKRLSRGAAVATAGTGTGFLAGMATWGILTPLTVPIGMLGGFGVGFMGNEITQEIQSKKDEIINLGLQVIYGKPNEFANEYFENPQALKGIKKKYLPTDKMIKIWGKEGAHCVASQYVKWLFHLHVKINYSDRGNLSEEQWNENKLQLEKEYKHFYRNYQMLRGDEDEIRKLYTGNFSAERAEKEIEKSKKILCQEQAIQDITAIIALLRKESAENTNAYRKAVSHFGQGVAQLTATENEDLHKQLYHSPEIETLPLEVWELFSLKKPLALSLEWKEKKSESNPLEIMVQQQDIIQVDETALEFQKNITSIKMAAKMLKEAERKKQEIIKKCEMIDTFCKIVQGSMQTANEIENILPGFINRYTHYEPDMDATQAANFLNTGEDDKFKYWFKDIFLIKYSNDIVGCKQAISGKLLDSQFNGKSILHLLAEDSNYGKDYFIFCMDEQRKILFPYSFLSYFDFNYQDKQNGMNAIVYTASLSGKKQNGLLKAYINELFIGYATASLEQQKNCDNTFKEIIQLKDGNPIYQIISIKLGNEIKKLWDINQNKIYNSKIFISRAIESIATLGVSKSFESEKILSQILSTMAIYCVSENKTPQNYDEIIALIIEFKNSAYINESIKDLLADTTTIANLAEILVECINEQSILYQFSILGEHEKGKKIAMELCADDVIPSIEEQKILVSLLKENTLENDEEFAYIIQNKKALIDAMIYNNKKFKGKNLIWLAIEAGRPEIAVKLYQYSQNVKFMDDAGLNHDSAFTFAASQENKMAYRMLSEELNTRTGLQSYAYASRFIPDTSNQKIIAHTIFQSGSINDIVLYLDIEKNRNRTPRWKRLTGGPDPDLKIEPKFYFDSEQNTPLYYLFLREDALEIIHALNEYIEKNPNRGLNTIFDLLDMEGLKQKNNQNQSSMSIIMNNEKLSDAIFIPFLEKANKSLINVEYKKNLFSSLKMAIIDEHAFLVGKHIKVLYENKFDNLALEYFIDDLIKLYNRESTNEESELILEALLDCALIATPQKIKELLVNLQGEKISNKNMHLIDRLNVAYIVNQLKADAVLDKNEIEILNNVFYLFDIGALEIKNKNQKSQISTFMSNEQAQENMIMPFINRVESESANSAYRKNLFNCVKIVVMHNNIGLLREIRGAIMLAHGTQKGLGIMANPVDAELDDLIDFLYEKYQMKSTPAEQKNSILRMLKLSGIRPEKVKAMLEKLSTAPNNKENRLLMNELKQIAIDYLILEKELLNQYEFVLPENNPKNIEIYDTDDSEVEELITSVILEEEIVDLPPLRPKPLVSSFTAEKSKNENEKEVKEKSEPEGSSKPTGGSGFNK